MVDKLINTLLEGLFPNYCILCGLRSHGPLPLCMACERDLHPNTSCCHRCALPLPPPQHQLQAGPAQQVLCGNCLQAPPLFDRVLAPWIYCDQLAHIIGRWKFHGETRLTPLLASLWLKQAATPGSVDLLIPVPLHWRRLWQRGFNQSELLCRQLHLLAPAIAAARVDHRSVKRPRATAAQSGIGARRRATNMRGAFTATGLYANLRIAIVDDVLTTGATASALADTLLKAGANHVELWCLARTPAPGG